MYEILALKYGERDTTKCQFFYRESSHDKLTLDYFVWLILGGPHPLLVDTGFLDDDARARGIRNYVSPAAMVERAGVKAADVPISLITHLHYDHWAGHSLFPNAEFWIQGDEVAFWTGPFGRTPARADHHEPAGDADGLRDDRRARRLDQARGRRPRSAGGPPVQAGGARNHQDRLTSNHQRRRVCDVSSSVWRWSRRRSVFRRR